jgi:hypothetical protein
MAIPVKRCSEAVLYSAQECLYKESCEIKDGSEMVVVEENERKLSEKWPINGVVSGPEGSVRSASSAVNVNEAVFLYLSLLYVTPRFHHVQEPPPPKIFSSYFIHGLCSPGFFVSPPVTHRRL